MPIWDFSLLTQEFHTGLTFVRHAYVHFEVGDWMPIESQHWSIGVCGVFAFASMLYEIKYVGRKRLDCAFDYVNDDDRDYLRWLISSLSSYLLSSSLQSMFLLAF
jgi:hypothetical protein